MIRLIDCEVYAVEREDITRSWLFSFFCNNHTEDMVVVYSGGVYEGVISYQKLLHTPDENVDGIINKGVYICKPDDSELFINLSRIFKDTSESLITLMNEDRQILYFAYDHDEYSEIEQSIKNLETDAEPTEIFIEDIYPNTKKVWIENLNEFAFRFYNILKKRGIPVEVYGEKWTVLFPGLCKKEDDVPESKTLKIYAEGCREIGLSTAGDIYNTWVFLIKLGNIKHNYITEKYRKKFEEDGIKCMTAYFKGDAGNSSIEELYRKTKEIVQTKVWRKADLFKEQIACVYGRPIEEEEWDKMVHARNEDPRYIHGLEEKICFGTAKNKIYLIGPCIVKGLTVTSLDDSLGGCLYREVRKLSEQYTIEGRVCNLSAVTEYENILKSLTITENDIVILIDQQSYLWRGGWTKDILIEDILSKRECDWFYDAPLHTNYVGNKEISKAICKEYLSNIIQNAKPDPKCIQAGRLMLNTESRQTIEQYIESIRVANTKEGMRIGSIVMNCNPMTNGHLYLIDTARKMVDLLYIFIVEEDKSDFAFHDRLELVQNETAFMDNVVVVPSGQFVLSYATMPLYFEKEEKKEAALDATDDLKVFGDYIAPELGITHRFVGEEPLDQVTRQYNEAMKNILPMYGVSIVEIPRLQQGEKFVSASMVRKYLKEGDMGSVKKIVPAGVYSYLCKNNSNC